MFSSATASPFASPLQTPLHPHSLPLSPLDTPVPSAPHSPASISIDFHSTTSNSKQPGANMQTAASAAPYSKAFGSLTPAGPSALVGIDSRRNSFGGPGTGSGAHPQAHSYDAPSRSGSSEENSHKRSQGSRLLFHGTEGGTGAMGGLNLDRDFSSRSASGRSTPTLGIGGSSGGSGNGLGPLTTEQLVQCGEALASGIVTSFDTKKKDAQGRTFLNCFFGKEAINCLRQRLPRSSNSAETCMTILQQMLTEGLLALAQSTEDLDRAIAAKFATSPPPPPTGGRASPGPAARQQQQQQSLNPLSLKLNLSAIGAAVPAPPTFKKEGLYQLATSRQWNSHGHGVHSAGPSSGANSAAHSLRSSPVMFGSVGSNTWYNGYSGYLGKKRENKGLGNSLALGFGVSTFQRRFFVCSAREQAVIYYKEDPNHPADGSEGGGGGGGHAYGGVLSPGSGTTPAPLPLGFIPFSEILLVDHLQSSSNALAAQNASSAGQTPPRGKKPSVDKTGGRATPPASASGASSPVVVADEKAGRLFDIVASFRVYHLQADTSMDAMRWAQAIKESVKDFYSARAERLLGAPAAQALNAGAAAGSGTLKLQAAARTPRTPEHSKRFWSNASTPSLNASAFPDQYLRQVLRDNTHTHTNGLYGAKLAPQRISDLRRHFFQLNFSISSLDQPSYFDHLMADFDTDAKIVEFCWNVIMRGTSNTDEWGPRSFRAATGTSGAVSSSGVLSPHSNASGTFSPSGVVSPQQAMRSMVDSSASTVLLTRMREAEEYAYEGERGDYTEAGDYEPSGTGATDADDDGQSMPGLSLSMSRGGGGGVLPPPRRHRRCISDSMLPDSIGRGLERIVGAASSGAEGARGAHHKRDDSFNLSALQARRELNNTRRFHRRFHSSLHPLPRALADDSYGTSGAGAASAASDRGDAPPPDKFHDFNYMLLNKYALYHASAFKALSTVSSGGTGSGLLNPPFLYRIFHPYKRIESWLHSDCFLNLLLNDAQLVNEVALALPLVWLVLQWRNHDTDPHACAGEDGETGGGGFIDDACLRKNWLDPAVDGEDDGYDGGAGDGVALNESEAREAKTAREESAKAGFRSVARAHLRVDSFSTVADTFAALSRAGPQGAAQTLSAGSPLSPPALATASAPPPVVVGTPHAHAHVPVVYGAHGQIVRGRQAPMGSPQSHQAQAGLTSPQSHSSTLYEYEAATPATPGASPYMCVSPLSQGPAPSSSPAPPTPVHIHLDHSGAGSGSGSGSAPRSHLLVRSISSPGGMQVPPPPTSLPPSGAGTSAGTGFQTPPRLHRAPPRLHYSPHTPHTPHTPLTPSMSPVPIGTPDMRKSSSGSGHGSGSYPERERRDVTFAGEVECLSGIGEREYSVSSTNSSRSELEQEPGGVGRGSDSAQSGEGVPLSARQRPAPRGSASMPNTRRNSLVHSSAAAAAAASHGKGSESGGGGSATATPRLLPRSVLTSASARTSPALSPQVRGRQRGAVFQSASPTMRPPNLLQGAGGGYATFRSAASTGSGGGYGSASASAAAQPPPPIPLGLPHWKVRSLVGCRFCFQSSLEFMQCVAERYGLDGAAAEAKRRRRARRAAAEAAGKPLRPSVCIEEPDAPPAELSIAISNTLFSLLLTPLYSLPSIHSPCLTDSFNVLGKCIVQPHIWPTIIACLQSQASASQRRPSSHIGSYSSSGLAAAAAAAASAAAAPHLKHHVLKDLNTLFIGSNVAANNRNCALLFKFFAAVARRERKDAQQLVAERERERKLSDKERERAERRRRRQPQKPTIGAWQQGLLELLRAHVPLSSSPQANSSGRYPAMSAADAGVERVHSKIYQFTLNLFGVLHFYKFQCIGASLSNLHLSGAKVAATNGGASGSGESLSTTCADFERLFKESFWRSMHMDDAVLAKRAKLQAAAAKRASQHNGLGHASGTEESSAASLRAAAYAAAPPLLAHTVARSMLTTMLQRLNFKIKSKTLHLEQRWPAVAFLLQLVKSFVFSMPLRQAAAIAGAGSSAGTSSGDGNGSTSSSGSGSGSSSSQCAPDPLWDVTQDFPAGRETLHRVPGQSLPTASLLRDDMELLEKALELLRALRLYQELDAESMGAAKQRELKAHVEAGAQSSGRGARLGDLHDPSRECKLNGAHEDLAALFRSLGPPDQAALRFLQRHVSFLKDAACFLAMMARHGRAANMDQKELTALVAHFVTIERREKVFCAK